MKRPKRAKVKYVEVTRRIYSVVCPHCKTDLVGGVERRIDRLFCRHCDNVIMLGWPAIVKKDQANEKENRRSKPYRKNNRAESDIGKRDV